MSERAGCADPSPGTGNARLAKAMLASSADGSLPPEPWDGARTDPDAAIRPAGPAAPLEIDGLGAACPSRMVRAVSSDDGDVTRILQALGRGDRDRAEELLDVVYAELHRLAERQMANERANHTLQPTALVHEVWLRLLGNAQENFDNRAHFFTAAGEAMRRILVDQARRRLARKRGGDRKREELDPAFATDEEDSADVVALSDALVRLEGADPRMASIVKLRYFVELSVEEVASVLGLSERTVHRDWAAARAWLFDELRGRDRDGSSR